MALTEPHKGISLNYEIYGEGPPLLLISGTGHNLEFWSNQLPYFAKKYSSIVFDNIISLTDKILSSSKNMCSVLQRPMPSAPKILRFQP